MNRLLFAFIAVSLIGLASPSTAQVYWQRKQYQQPRAYPQQRVYPNAQQWPARPRTYQQPHLPAKHRTNNHQYQQPRTYQPSPYQQPQNPAPNGQTRRVLPDGRIVITTPFSDELKREIAKREASRIQLRKDREREIDQQGNNESLYPRLPAEFEKQKAIMISLADWQSHHLSVLIDLIEKTRGHVNLLILYNDKNQHDEKPQINDLLDLLVKTGKDYPHLKFLNVNLDTIWLRDYGPRTAQTESGDAMVMNFFYDTIRPLDDDFPKLWSDATNARYNQVPWGLQGGNLLTNGQGLAIATSRIYEDNRLHVPEKSIEQEEEFVRQRLMKYCNIKELVVLKPLEQEQTRHADMFSTFLAADLVLVAQLDRRVDPVNASILDYNAQLLSKTKVDGRPLRVERIWIPPRRGENWSPFTNIILTDGLVLIPTYNHDPPQYVKAAVQTYKRLLPNHQVTTVDMTSMDKLGGSLHCLSCPIPSFAELPKDTMSFQQVIALSNKSPVKMLDSVGELK